MAGGGGFINLLGFKLSSVLMNISVQNNPKGIRASGKLVRSAQFQALTSVVKNVINISVPAPWRWQPGPDELRQRQSLLQPLFLLSDITQYDLTAQQLL